MIRPNVRSRRLPPYRGIVAVDAKDFTGYPAIQHEEISRSIQQVLDRSLADADLAEVWHDRRFPNSTGDGYVFGFPPEFMPFVIHPWLGTLQRHLTEFNLNSVGVVRLRLRVSLNIGPLPDEGGEFDGNGTARNDTHRLLDSRPVKALLTEQSPNITHVAAILSDRCYQDAVASGYTGRHMDHFVEVPATVEGKPFAQRAWLYVPEPSGNLRDPRVLGGDTQAPHDEPAASGAPERAPAPDGLSSRFQADGGIINTGTHHGAQQITNHHGGAR
ncbi:hypothetical protein FH715_14050 [Streptomyces sedi]|uniref:Uncharacterized protein n=2 Tax=Streptomyces sedi TaxID=555059 RepID=A0A5C4V1T4_9ACTN|nr:hypothetical protein FH715_14050 [Streptomyces sedi]